MRSLRLSLTAALAASCLPACQHAPTREPRPVEPIEEACRSPQHQAFDFWRGTWVVRDSAGAVLGRNEIARTADGCGLLERWRGREGGTGTSINFYDPAAGDWTQVWVGGDGVVLRLRGGPHDDGAMELSGEDRPGPAGAVRDRIRWTPQTDGRVLQEWFVSSDDGLTWQPVFRGWYEPERTPSG